MLELMTRIYCRAKHKTKKGLCDECAELLSYATQRREKCPFGDEKTFCSNCKIHCYKPEMREKIAKVMRFSGPRTVFYHPTVAFGHLFETLKYKRKSKKEEKERNKNVKENN
ncbi:MAG: nitrous oxide-stimulated promoter family protein [Clostridia bacterium]|nr:nitrous oxide-stimulated promoter family protein [Clostridia bacterium]